MIFRSGTKRYYPGMPKRVLMLSILFVAVIAAAGTAYFMYRPNPARIDKFRQWIQDPESHPD